MKPIGLLDAFELAKHMEIAIDYQHKKSKIGILVGNPSPETWSIRLGFDLTLRLGIKGFLDFVA
jgi:hypothetical protein